jgi:hypothetical protein
MCPHMEETRQTLTMLLKSGARITNQNDRVHYMHFILT